MWRLLALVRIEVESEGSDAKNSWHVAIVSIETEPAISFAERQLIRRQSKGRELVGPA